MKISKRIKRTAGLGLALVPALAVAQYWIFSLVRGESLSVAAIYRHGDYNYFPPLAGLAHLTVGEWLVLEQLGEGIRSFPFPSLAIHGIALGLFDAAGYVVADILVAVLVYFAARRFLRASGLSFLTTAIIALVVSCGLLGWPGHHLQQWFGWAPAMHLWGFRFPRPFLTDLFLLLCLGSWLRIVVERREGTREWAVLGVWFGLLLQSRYYAAATVGLAIGVIAPFLTFRHGGSAVRTLRGLACFASTTVLVALPFAAQRLLEHPDVPTRLGAFPVERLRPFFLEGALGEVVRASLFAVLVAAVLAWSTPPRSRDRMAATVGLTLLLLLSTLALPASIVVLGETIQPYHFRHELRTFKALLLVVGVGHVLDVGASLLQRRLPGTGRLPSWPRVALLSIVAVGCLVGSASLHWPWILRENHMRADFAAYRVRGYREAFRELTRELASERHARARVLATLDIQVLDWWSLFGGGHAFCPEPCASNLSDEEIESRLLRFFRILGASERDMMRLVRERSVLVFFLGCAKYQVSRGHHFAPLDDYPPAVRRAFLRSSPLSSWLVALPDSEAERLREAYSRALEVDDDLRLDLIVLGPGPLDRRLAPDPERFELTFANERFRVFARREP